MNQSGGPMKLDELATFGSIALLFVLMAYAIITTAMSYEREESSPPIDTRPEIHDCGLSTWDEIRGECNDSDNRHTDNGS